MEHSPPVPALSLSSLKTLRPDTPNHCVTPFSLSFQCVCASNPTFCCCSCPAVWAYLFSLYPLLSSTSRCVCTFKWWTDASTKETPTPTKGQRNQTDARHIIPNFFFLLGGLDKLKEEEDHTLIGNTKNKTIAGRKKKKKANIFLRGNCLNWPTVCLSPLLW